jgi:hypothetical protein
MEVTMKAKQVLLLLGVGVAAAIAGYALAYAVSSEWLDDVLRRSGDSERVRGVLTDITGQAFCAGPILLVIGAALAAMVALLQRAVKISIVVGCIIVAAPAFIAAFVTYFPLQLLLLMAAAF